MGRFDLIDPRELIFEYSQSSGPGGQNINKVATAVRLRFDIRNSPSITKDVKTRLERLAGRRLSKEGVLIIECHRYRSRKNNQLDAMERFYSLVRRASVPPKPRKVTRPTRSSVEKRLVRKRFRSLRKKDRRFSSSEE